MKKIFLVILLLPLAAFSQFTDDFSDGNFTANPVWAGDNSKFVVNTDKHLRSNGVQAQETNIYLSTQSTKIDNAEWSFWAQINYNTSSSNYSKVYIVSDSAKLNGSLHGYFVQLGGSSDNVVFYEQNGTTPTQLITSTNINTGTSNNKFLVKVTRDASGNWKLYTDKTATGNNYFLDGSCNNTAHTTTSWFGVSYSHTTSTDTLYYWDDFYVGDITADITKPTVNKVVVTSSTTLDVYFSESINSVTASNPANYSVDKLTGNPVNAFAAPNSALAQLTFQTPFSASTVYTITISNIDDLSGNIMEPANKIFALAEPPVAGDVVINELLSHAYTDGKKYVELYNRSDKVIDAKDLKIAAYDSTTKTVGTVYTITDNSYTLFPQSYVALTTDTANVKNLYTDKNPEGFIEIQSFPSGVNNDAGAIALVAASDEALFDKFVYNAAMYFPLLASQAGVSFERICPDRPSDDKTNWLSAAQDAGFGTPGYQNSQFNCSDETVSDPVSVSPEIFSPDQDGYNDVLNINYKFDEPGYMATITIYDPKGRLVRNLEKNEYLGTSGTFSWDGITNEREKARIGIYVIYVEVFDLAGNMKHYKKTAVLASKM